MIAPPAATVIPVVAGAAVAGFVQGLSGFAFTMTAMTVWAWFLDPKLAASLVVFGAVCGQVVAIVATRHPIHFKAVTPYLVGGMIGIPLGVLAIPYVNNTMLRFGLGLFLVIYCPAMLLSKRLPTIRWNGPVAAGTVGFIGGALGGLAGLSGPVPTLWCVLHRMEKDAQRAIIQSFNLAILGVSFLTQCAAGVIHRGVLPYFGIVAASLVIPATLGSRLYIRMNDRVLKQTILSLLGLSGAALLLSARR